MELGGGHGFWENHGFPFIGCYRLSGNIFCVHLHLKTSHCVEGILKKCQNWPQALWFMNVLKYNSDSSAFQKKKFHFKQLHVMLHLNSVPTLAGVTASFIATTNATQ